MALALVAGGGGAVAAYNTLASHGAQADILAPGGSYLFAEADLDPSASEKLQAWQFARHFPDAPRSTNSRGLKDALLRAAFGAKVDYNTQIEPWLGSRVAIAAFTDAAGKPEMLAILQTKDAAAARIDIAKVVAESNGSSSTTGYVISNGYVVMAATQAIAQEAVRDAHQRSLAQNPTYVADTALLSGNRIFTAWANIPAIWQSERTTYLKALGSYMPGSYLQGLHLPGSAPALPKINPTGRLVYGLSVTSSSIDLQGRLLGWTGKPALLSGTAGEALGRLPAGTLIGVAIGSPAQLVKRALGQLDAYPSLHQEVVKAMASLGSQFGVSLPADAENLLGADVAVGIDSLHLGASGGAPTPTGLTALSEPTNMSAAERTVAQLERALPSGYQTLHVTGSGGWLDITNDPTRSTGILAQDPRYEAAMAGMPKDVSAACYIDLHGILSGKAGMSRDAKVLDTLAVYVGTDKVSPVFSMKLTVR